MKYFETLPKVIREDKPVPLHALQCWHIGSGIKTLNHTIDTEVIRMPR